MLIPMARTGPDLGSEPGASSVALIWLIRAHVRVCFDMLLTLEIRIRGWAGIPLCSARGGRKPGEGEVMPVKVEAGNDSGVF
ncbi:hypothetical protein [Paludisphaera borealis]|uniref:Uncharacterized protein n=1 Tax=Paludisphaera borealis TaxID=1387353 RepID=A0A1U7CNR7_9BACT|nr:hypothetical protein [Paludisphaera borealis]APW60558.1 hypothetical protein BSF38_02031 [Paludisphaera borealis]